MCRISSGSLETCLLIRVRPKNNLYLAPRTIGFDGEVFYSLWQEMEAPQLAVGPWEDKIFCPWANFWGLFNPGDEEISIPENWPIRKPYIFMTEW